MPSNEEHCCYEHKRCTDHQDIERLRKSHIDLLRVDEADHMRDLATFKANLLLRCKSKACIHRPLETSSL